MANTSDILDLFTDKKKADSGNRLNRSMSREGHTLKAIENRLTQKINTVSDKH
jgi:hypothetical protein